MSLTRDLVYLSTPRRDHTLTPIFLLHVLYSRTSCLDRGIYIDLRCQLYSRLSTVTIWRVVTQPRNPA